MLRWPKKISQTSNIDMTSLPSSQSISTNTVAVSLDDNFGFSQTIVANKLTLEPIAIHQSLDRSN